MRKILAVLSLFFSFNAFAITYTLDNHPDGTETNKGPDAPNHYGLRLDFPFAGSVNDNNAADRTFSVISLTLEYDPDAPTPTAVMTGTISRNSNPADIYNVNHVFSGVTPHSSGNGFEATGGKLTLSGGLDAAINGMYDSKQNGSGIAFALLHDGHRVPGSTAPVARGWLMAAGTNDWLLTATVVPLPAAAWLFISGLAGLGLIRRRKQTQVAA